MDEKSTLTPYDIMDKTEQQVRCEVYDRLLRVIQRCGTWSTEEVIANIGQDTLFNIVTDTYLVYVNNGASASHTYIEKAVHELFITQKGGG